MNDANTIRDALDLIVNHAFADQKKGAAALAALDRLEAEVGEMTEREKTSARSYLAQIDLRRAAEAELEEARKQRDDNGLDFFREEARAVAAEERVAFLVCEAHGWQPKLEAALAERDDAMATMYHIRDEVMDGVLIRCEAAEARVAALEEALSWSLDTLLITLERLDALDPKMSAWHSRIRAKVRATFADAGKAEA